MGSHATREIASEDIPDATISLDNSSPGKDGKFHAVPVDIVQLVAHIIAFERTLEPLRTLTLCHLYGRGTSVSITKLPVELIDMIRDFFILDERAVQRELCEESFRCFTNVCSYFYHADDDQAYQAKWRLAKEHGWSRDFGHDCSNCWYSDHFTQDEVENMFCILENDYNDAWTDLEKILKAEYGKLIDGEHHCRANKWFKKVHIGSVRSVIPPAPSIDSILNVRFGLEVRAEWSSIEDFTKAEDSPCHPFLNPDHSLYVACLIKAREHPKNGTLPTTRKRQLNLINRGTRVLGLAPAVTHPEQAMKWCPWRITALPGAIALEDVDARWSDALQSPLLSIMKGIEASEWPKLVGPVPPSFDDGKTTDTDMAEQRSGREDIDAAIFLVSSNYIDH